MQEKRERSIIEQREEQYGSLFKAESLEQRADDLRRNLILKYGATPEQRSLGEKPRDMWRDIAKDIIELTGGGPDLKGLDAGMSSGYFMTKMFEEGYSGAVAGIDIVASDDHLKLLSRQFEGKAVDLGIADAEKLDSVKVFRGHNSKGEIIFEDAEIPDNFFDFAVSLNTFHHTEYPEEILKSLWRKTKPGGYIAAMARAVGHFDNIYNQIAPRISEKYNTALPEPFYSKYDFMELDNFIDNFPGFRRITPHAKGLQAGWLYIDDSEEGRRDISNVVYSLISEFEPLEDTDKLTEKQLRGFLNRHLRTNYFNQNVLFHIAGDGGDKKGFVTEFVFQKYTIAEVIK